MQLTFGQVFRGSAPVIVATPHIGTTVPPELQARTVWADIDGRLSDPAGVALQQAAISQRVTCVSARLHPCVVDFNVALDHRPLSAGLNRSGLCRTHTSRGEALYEPGAEPSETEVQARVDAYWRPYHDALTDELLRLRAVHANVLLLVSHASSWLSPYRSQVDAADCNAATNRGTSCDQRLVSALTKALRPQARSWVVNGKLADNFAAQRYGQPERGVHVIEIEVAGRWRNELELPKHDRADAAPSVAGMTFFLTSLTHALGHLPPAEALVKAELVAGGQAY
ncbi:N-formylglutamate amidohydrolase [Caballeronia sp. GACF4]|uniref:N-formylglutamate amidohydrolase n=1 Tax=Caballeronia sp. GACF4 TaxID=2921763 RepID=UPI0020284C9B|nr:N-formylglutamate amidohydrolase [Caballeronia sp. GACF4]